MRRGNGAWKDSKSSRCRHRKGRIWRRNQNKTIGDKKSGKQKKGDKRNRKVCKKKTGKTGRKHTNKEWIIMINTTKGKRIKNKFDRINERNIRKKSYKIMKYFEKEHWDFRHFILNLNHENWFIFHETKLVSFFFFL